MLNLTLAALAFVGIHLFVSGTPLRDRLVARLGDRGYLGAFSLASAGLLAWLIWAFVDARVPAPTALGEYRAVAHVLVFVALLLIVLGNTTRGVTEVGGERRLEGVEPARGVHRITRHPLLLGIALWAATHMLFNPEPPTLVFFGAFFVLGLFGPGSIDAKRARSQGARWHPYAQATSVLPFAAIAGGRNRLALDEIKWWQWLAAIGVFAAFALLHGRLFGMAVV